MMGYMFKDEFQTEYVDSETVKLVKENYTEHTHDYLYHNMLEKTNRKRIAKVLKLKWIKN
jgi:hypothetical protein